MFLKRCCSDESAVKEVIKCICTRFCCDVSSCDYHYCDVIMGTAASQITSLTIVYTTVYSDADQSKHQSSASLAFVWGIHRSPVNSPHKWPVPRKMFPFDDVIMICSELIAFRSVALVLGQSGNCHKVIQITLTDWSKSTILWTIKHKVRTWHILYNWWPVLLSSVT